MNKRNASPPPEAIANRPSGDLHVKKVSHCVVTHSSLAISLRGVDPACLFDFVTGRSRLEMNLMAVGSLLMHPLSLAPRSDRYVHVFNLWGTGYHHWLAEVALKMFLFEDQCRKSKIILPEKCPSFVNEFLELFGFNNTFQLSGGTYFKELDIISNPYSGHFNEAQINLFRQRLLDRVVPDSSRSGRTRKIYISRRGARARKVVNEDEVISFLSESGFDCLELDNMSFVEQVRIFSECSTLVSLHGAGLTNMLFMPRGSHVIEIYPGDFDARDYFNACYRRLADVLGISHTYLFADREFPENAFTLDTDNVRVNIEEFEQWIADA